MGKSEQRLLHFNAVSFVRAAMTFKVHDVLRFGFNVQCSEMPSANVSELLLVRTAVWVVVGFRVFHALHLKLTRR